MEERYTNFSLISIVKLTIIKKTPFKNRHAKIKLNNKKISYK